MCYSVCRRLRSVGAVRWRYCEVLEVIEAMRCVLLCMLEVVKGRLCSLEVIDVMRHVLLCMPEAVEGELCLLEVM